MKSTEAQYISPDKQYISADHMTYSCQYHVIFCPKYRRKVLTDGIDARLKEILLQVAGDNGFSIIEMEVMPDHVHMIVSCDPRLGIYSCVCRLKGTSSRLLREEFPKLRSKLPTLWSRGMFISSVGAVSLSVVKKYIEDQKGV